MSAQVASVVIMMSVLLAGCSFLNESREGVDKGEYDGGPGLALSLKNDATDAFDVKIQVLAAKGPVGWYNVTLQPGESLSKWWSLDRSTYTVRMSYHWDAEAGRAATGLEDVTVDLNECPIVSKVGFVYRREADTIGHVTDPKTCITEDDE